MREALRTFTPLFWAVALIVLMIVALLALSWCSDRSRLNQARAERDQAQGRTVSAVEAITEIGKLEDRGRATEAQVQEAENAIRQAAPADRDRVARHRLCILQHRPDCERLFGVGAADPDA